ncbi:MAG: NAD(P)/FAD-dependent oxidoreductase [Pikeienuella sp.]
MGAAAERADVIVIGAGIAGASVASELAASSRVLLIEAESQPGYHTTGRSAATFAPSYGPDGVRALTRASHDFLDAPPNGFAATPLLSPRGILMIAREDQREALEALIDAVSHETATRRMGAEEALRLQPLLRRGYAAEGMFDGGGRDIDVAALHQGYLRHFRANGGRLLTDAPVEALERSAGGWEARTRQGCFEAPVVVNAAGAWADQLGRMAGAETIGLTPKRRTALVVAEPEGFTGRDAPITIDIDEAFYLKPDAGRLLISPADETPSAPCDAQPEELDVAICIDRITTAFDLEIRRIDNKWAGLRSFVPDKEPVIGYSAVAPGFFWMAGQGGYGVQTAPVASRLAAALIRRRPVPDPISDHGFDPALVAPERLRAGA